MEVPVNGDSGVDTEGDQESSDSFMSNVSAGLGPPSLPPPQPPQQPSAEVSGQPPAPAFADEEPQPGPSNSASANQTRPTSTSAAGTAMSPPNSTTSSSVSDSNPETPEPPVSSSMAGPSNPAAATTAVAAVKHSSSMLQPPFSASTSAAEDGYLGDCSSDGGNEKNFPVPPEKLERLMLGKCKSRAGAAIDSIDPPAGLSFQSVQPDLVSACGYSVAGSSSGHGVSDRGGGSRKVRSLLRQRLHGAHNAGGGASWSHLKAAVAGRKLRLAANFNDAGAVERLLSVGAADPNSVDEHRRSALHFAAAKGYSEASTIEPRLRQWGGPKW